jgi:methylamine dehydrogenase accessory protein MauD
MEQALLVSNVVLWIAVVALSFVMLALVRQLGVLHARTAPAGALVLGARVRVGEAAPRQDVVDLDGRVHAIGAPRADGRGTLLFFVSPSCPVCKELLPAVRALAAEERGRVEVMLASDGPREEHEPFVRAERLERFPYLLSPGLGIALGVAKLPYAVLLDAGGVLRAHGLVNSREQLDSLFEADARGVASLQDYLRRRTEPDAERKEGTA